MVAKPACSCLGVTKRQQPNLHLLQRSAASLTMQRQLEGDLCFAHLLLLLLLLITVLEGHHPQHSATTRSPGPAASC